MRRSKKLKAVLSGVFALTLALAATACAKKSAAEDVKITMQQREMTMEVGQSARLRVSVEPTDAMDKTIRWKSSDEDVLRVENGVITALTEGEATVTATTNETSDSCKITVLAKGENAESVQKDVE